MVESAVPFLVLAFMFGITWLVAICAYLGREKPPEAVEESTLSAVVPDLEQVRFLATPAETPTAVETEQQVDTAVILSLERYLQEEQSCAARFVAAPSIELLYRQANGLTAVA